MPTMLMSPWSVARSGFAAFSILEHGLSRGADAAVPPSVRADVRTPGPARCKTPEIARASRRFPHISASQVLICGMRACWGEVSGVLPPRHRFLPPRPTARGGRCRRRVGELGGPGRLHAGDPASAPVPDPRGGERSASRAGRPLSLLRGSPQTPRSARLVRLIADPAVGRSPSAGGSPNAVAGA